MSAAALFALFDSFSHSLERGESHNQLENQLRLKVWREKETERKMVEETLSMQEPEMTRGGGYTADQHCVFSSDITMLLTDMCTPNTNYEVLIWQSIVGIIF